MNDPIELVNVEKLCRLCLSGDEPTSPILNYSETSVPLADRIQTYLSIEILSNDKLSTRICTNCINTLNHWHLYRESCLQSQEKLQKWLAKQSTTAEPLAVDVKTEPMEGETDDEEVEAEESLKNQSEINRQASPDASKGRQRKQIHRVRNLHKLANTISHEDDDDDDDDEDDDDDNDNDDYRTEERFTMVDIKIEPTENEQTNCNNADVTVPEQNDCENEIRRPHHVRKPRDSCMDTLPEKSKTRYLSTYETFNQWMESEGETAFSEDVLLSYFTDLDSKYCPTTLWSIYSMLKTTINNKHSVDISTYTRLLSYIKKKMTGFKKKTPKVFTAEQIQRFVFEAPDNPYLITKVVAIFGVIGGCRAWEICNIMTNDVKDFANSILKVTVWKSETQIDRTFTIEGYCYKIVKKYMNLRPDKTDTNRFFLNYRNSKCTRQVIGKNKIALCPKQVADFLLIPNSNEYTGHSFRKTSPVSLTDSGIDLGRLRVKDILPLEPVEKKTHIKRRLAYQRTLKNNALLQAKSLAKKLKTDEVIDVEDNSRPEFKASIEVEATQTVDATALSELDGTLEITPINNDAKIILSTSTTDSVQKPVYNFYNCTIKSSKL